MYISEIRTKAPADERMPLEQKWIKRSEQRSGRMSSSVTRRRQPSFCW